MAMVTVMDTMDTMDITMARGLLSPAMATMVMDMVTATDTDTMDIMDMEDRCIVKFLSRVLMW